MNHWHFIIGAYGVTLLVFVVEIFAVRARRLASWRRSSSVTCAFVIIRSSISGTARSLAMPRALRGFGNVSRRYAASSSAGYSFSSTVTSSMDAGARPSRANRLIFSAFTRD